MKKRHCKLIFIVVLLLSACNSRNQDKDDLARLTKLDRIISANPQGVQDSLKHINPTNLSRYNRAYYQLLDVISKDKMYYSFNSDSVINQSAKTLSRYKKQFPKSYARALMYQGIIRFRTGVKDSTAYEPLKMAVTAFNNITPKDYQNLSLCTHHLALINDNSRNIEYAYTYLKKSVEYAKKINRKEYLIDNYFELGWNRIEVNDLSRVKLYLDTIQQFSLSEKDKSDLKIISAVYYLNNKEYEKAILLEKEILQNIDQKDSVSLSSAYIRIFDNYKNKKEYSAAFKYLDLATKYFTDTVNIPTHLLYKYLGELGDKTGKYKSGLKAYGIAYRQLTASIKKQTDTKILELEKKYNVAQIETKKLQVEKQRAILLLIAFILLVTIITGIVLRKRHLINEKNKWQQMAQENDYLEQQQQQMVKEKDYLEQQQRQLQQEAFRKQWISKVYQHNSENDQFVLDIFYKLEANPYLKKNEEISQLINETIREYKKRGTKIATSLLDNDVFVQLSGIDSSKIEVLLDSEKLLLVLTYLGLTNSQIAAIISSTPESVRKRRKKIEQKLEIKAQTTPIFIAKQAEFLKNNQLSI